MEILIWLYKILNLKMKISSIILQSCPQQKSWEEFL